MKASFQGHNEIIELLLAAGANMDLKNKVRHQK
jgi:ankyrin repeat protein